MMGDFAWDGQTYNILQFLQFLQFRSESQFALQSTFQENLVNSIHNKRLVTLTK
jgi:hypothetical protein